MFTTEMIRTRVRKQPFIPLRIVTSSAEAYLVRHPDLIMVGTGDLLIGLPSAKDPMAYKDLSRVSLLHITALEDMPMAKVPKGNAKK